MNQSSMNQLIVDLAISSDEYVKLYQGAARVVHTHSRDGRRVHFPANILVPFVEHNGVHGSFVIQFDSNNRFQQIQRI